MRLNPNLKGSTGVSANRSVSLLPAVMVTQVALLTMFVATLAQVDSPNRHSFESQGTSNSVAATAHEYGHASGERVAFHLRGLSFKDHLDTNINEVSLKKIIIHCNPHSYASLPLENWRTLQGVVYVWIPLLDREGYAILQLENWQSADFVLNSIFDHVNGDSSRVDSLKIRNQWISLQPQKDVGNMTEPVVR